MPVTDSSEKVVRMPYYYYPIWFQEEIRALLNSSSKVNAMNPNLAQKLSLYIWKNNVGAQKMDGSTLKTFE